MYRHQEGYKYANGPENLRKYLLRKRDKSYSKDL